MSDGAPHATDGPVLDWSDSFVLGHEPMDATHREFVALVRAMQTGPEDRLAALLAEFEAHARRHFADEDRWMVETHDCGPESETMYDSEMAVYLQKPNPEVAKNIALMKQWAREGK